MPGKNNRRALRRKNGLQARQPAEPIRPLRSFLGAPFGVIPSCGLVQHRERASTAPLVGRVGGSVGQARWVGISWWVRGVSPRPAPDHGNLRRVRKDPPSATIGSGAEARPILLRRYTDGSDKTSSHRLFASKPTALRNALRRQSSIREQSASSVDAQTFDAARRCVAGSCEVVTAETSLAHAAPLCKHRE